MFYQPTLRTGLLLALASLLFGSCTGKRLTQSNNSNQPAARATDTTKSTDTGTAKPPTAAGLLKVGEASGTYSAKGETVPLKYAYAGRAQRFGEDSVVILLTDREIPADALSDELKNQTLLLDEKIRGLEYVIM